MSPNTLHTWSAIGSIATAIGVIGALLSVIFRGSRWASRWTAGLVNATRANTTAVAELTRQMRGVSSDVIQIRGEVGSIATQTALNTDHIKHNTSRIVKLEKEIGT